MMDNQFVAINKCFFCGENKDLIIHRKLSDISKLHGKVTDLEPCDKCREYMEQGVILVSVRDGEAQSMEPYRTGGFWVISVEAAKRIFNNLGDNRFAFIEDSVAEQVGLTKLQTA